MSKLQAYFEYFKKYDDPRNSEWYDTLKSCFDLMQSLKQAVRQIPNFPELGDEEKRTSIEIAFSTVTIDGTSPLPNIDSFLDKYVFQQSNGIGDVKQGVVWDTDDNPHQDQIRQNATPELIYDILTIEDKSVVNAKVDQLLSSDRGLYAVHNRLMRTIFPNDFASPDAPGKLDRLLYAIKNKFGTLITGESILDKHENLCQLISTDDPILRQIFTWELYYMLENEFHLKKAVCYYGAPGTGKTYQSSIEAKKLIDTHRIIAGKEIGGDYAIKTVQFHPSYSYEDFLEGIRPNSDGNLSLFNGSFKQFCKDNGSREINLYKTTNFLHIEKFKILNYDFSRIKIKELSAEHKVALGLATEDSAEGLTIQDVIEPAFFIIDEINRAELSKVFGELMYSLEYRGYRGKLKTQYSHLCKSETDDATFYWENDENWFFIPQNIYLIATMNNIDRSVDAFDFALRRRFMWVEVEPNYDIVESELTKAGWDMPSAKSLRKNIEALNSLIENDDILDKNYRIGQSYILELTKLNPDRFDEAKSAPTFIWKNFIEPLLEEYLKGLGNESKAKEKISRFKDAFIK